MRSVLSGNRRQGGTRTPNVLSHAHLVGWTWAKESPGDCGFCVSQMRLSDWKAVFTSDIPCGTSSQKCVET